MLKIVLTKLVLVGLFSGFGLLTIAGAVDAKEQAKEINTENVLTVTKTVIESITNIENEIKGFGK